MTPRGGGPAERARRLVPFWRARTPLHRTPDRTPPSSHAMVPPAPPLLPHAAARGRGRLRSSSRTGSHAAIHHAMSGHPWRPSNSCKVPFRLHSPSPRGLVATDACRCTPRRHGSKREAAARRAMARKRAAKGTAQANGDGEAGTTARRPPPPPLSTLALSTAATAWTCSAILAGFLTGR